MEKDDQSKHASEQLPSYQNETLHWNEMIYFMKLPSKFTLAYFPFEMSRQYKGALGTGYAHTVGFFI